MPEQGDVILIPVPFTDLSSQKRRPVIVISNDDYNRQNLDIVVVAMTSNPAQVDHSFRVSKVDLAEGALNRPGTVRPDKIYTLAKAIAQKKFAKVARPVVERIRSEIAALTDPS
jgi:mRNA interferase MazF